MKTKLSMIIGLLALSINVAFAGNGSLGVGYASDYFRRGALLSEEAVQAEASYGFKAFGLDSSIGVFTNQAVTSGAVDAYIIDADISGTWGDLVILSAGLEHAELVAGAANLDVGVSVGLKSVLSPTVSLYRDVDETLYMIEVAVSHSFDLDVATLSVGASYGQSETSSTVDVDYNAVGAALTKSLSDTSSLELSVTSVDSDSIARKTIVGAGINVKF